MRRPLQFLLTGSLLGLFPPGTLMRTTASLAHGSIAGTVRDAQGKPIAGARVTLRTGSRASITDSAGAYRLDSVPVGWVRVSALAIGYRPATDSVRVSEAGVSRLDFKLSADALRLEERIVTTSKVLSRRALGMVGAFAPGRQQYNTEEYRRIVDNPWRSPLRDPLSTFSADVDAGSYSNVRRFIANGELPPKDAVRIEEMINYFRYDYPEPSGEHPLSVTTEIGGAPWQPAHKLVLIGLQTRRIPLADLPPNNLIFLLDVSGSMNEPNKLPLVQAAFQLLVDQLRPEDRVAIVVYAGAAGLVLPSTPGSQKDKIRDAIARLEPGGSTAGAAGIKLAYQIAREAFLPEGNNRVILATDGDFNVGVSSDGELTRLIEEERGHGVFLTVLGFGMGNLKDAKLEQLADQGNGHYAYVDNLLEARKVFVQELGATLLTVAKDVKLQVEFNPQRVQAYRLVGYEKRLLANEDFNNDAKDAGDLGAGHSVTALYEIVPAGVPLDVKLGSVDPLRYQPGPPANGSAANDDWLTVKVRYKPPAENSSRLLSQVLRGESGASNRFRWAAAVAGVGMLLRDSEEKGRCTWTDMLALARGARGEDAEGYRAEFLRVMEAAAQLAGRSKGGSQ